MTAVLELLLSGRTAHGWPPVPQGAHRPPPGIDEDDDTEDERPIGDPDDDEGWEDDDEDDEDPLQVRRP